MAHYWNEKRRRWSALLMLIIVLAVVTGVVILALYSNQTTPEEDPYSYVIVADAGSSHTDFYVYSFIPLVDNQTATIKELPFIHELSGRYECPLNKSISSFAANPSGVGKYLDYCLQKAAEIVPGHKHRVTPIVLGATAGMRLLHLDNRTAAEEIMDNIRDRFQSSGFDHSMSSAEILSGAQEGASGWITANYLAGNLRNLSQTMNGDLRLPAGSTQGALDMGGASTQISFIPAAGDSSNTTTSFTLYNHTITLYTKSYLCFGSNSAFQMLNASLLQEVYLSGSNATSIANPCSPLGLNSSFSLSDVAYFGTEYCSANYTFTKTQGYNVSGTSDPSSCYSLVSQLVKNNSIGLNQPPLDGNFLAFSAYTTLVDFLCTYQQGYAACRSNQYGFNITLGDLRARVDGVCSLTWTDLMNMVPAGFSLKYLSTYCFMGQYIIAILEEGYGFPESYSPSANNLYYADMIGNETVGWTLGYVLNQSSIMFPPYIYHKPSKNIEHSDVVVASIVLAVIVAVCLVLITVIKISSSRTRSYSEL